MLNPITSRGGRKRSNRSLDPGNKCITSKIFVDAIRSEANRKEKGKEEKEEKKEREGQDSSRKKEKSRRKNVKKDETKSRKRKSRTKKDNSDKGVKKKKTTKGRKGRKNIENLVEQRVTYSCGSCNKMYVEDEEEDWIECDFCDTWYHVQCTDLPVLDALDGNMDYTCAICVDQGFPSHEAN